MKEKRKGKFIPFASYLRPTEELLWQSAEKADILASLMPRASLSNFISLALFLMVVGGCGITIDSKPDAFVGLLGFFIAMVGERRIPQVEEYPAWLYASIFPDQ